MIQATIKQKTSPQTQECAPPNPLSLPRTPDLANMAAGLHTLRMQGRKCSSPEDSPHAPITLMPLPSIPTHSSHPGSQSEAVYADPVRCIQSEPEPQSAKALYVDPASVLPTHPPGSKQSPPDQNSLPNRQDSIYSEVYDKISAEEVKKPASAQDEPIYSEPVRESASQSQSHADPFAHLYAQVRKAPAPSRPPVTASTASTAPSCSRSTPAARAQADDDDDVIYENMGII